MQWYRLILLVPTLLVELSSCFCTQKGDKNGSECGRCNNFKNNMNHSLIDCESRSVNRKVHHRSNLEIYHMQIRIPFSRIVNRVENGLILTTMD